MSQVLIVSYDLVDPGQTYPQLLKLIKSYSGWAKLGGSAYLIATDRTPKQVRDHLITTMDGNDKLFVGVASAPSAWHALSDEVAKWILANQK